MKIDSRKCSGHIEHLHWEYFTHVVKQFNFFINFPVISISVVIVTCVG